MNYLDRYQNGDHELVWSDLQALGTAVRQEPYYVQARAVAAETMRRVRRNCERLVSRLSAADYIFGIYPDGSCGYYTQGPLVPPTDQTRSDYAKLDAQTGPIPLSLALFWQEVGSVDFVGWHRAWPEMLDPLVIEPPEAALADLTDRGLNEEGPDQLLPFEAPLAPDVYHKDNVSGGAPYTMNLPDAHTDSLIVNERHRLRFVPYLRLAILRWGGFPGLDGRDVPFAPLPGLVADLEPF